MVSAEPCFLAARNPYEVMVTSGIAIQFGTKRLFENVSVKFGSGEPLQTHGPTAAASRRS